MTTSTQTLSTLPTARRSPRPIHPLAVIDGDLEGLAMTVREAVVRGGSADGSCAVLMPRRGTNVREAQETRGIHAV